MAQFKDVAVKKTTSLNLVTGFFQYLRGKWSSYLSRETCVRETNSTDLYAVCAVLYVGETDA